MLYLFKTKNIPFFKVIYARDLLLIDSVVNDFEDDVKESLSTRWFLVPKKIFKKYDSYAYEFLTRDKEKILQNENYVNVKINNVNSFYIPSFHHWKEIEDSNISLKDIYIKFNIEEVIEDEK